MAESKIDFKKQLKGLYSPSAKEPSIVDVPSMSFLILDGKGDPDGSDFQDAVQALYGATFTIKFALKAAKVGPEYTVPPLEGLWWMAGDRPFDQQAREEWLWRAMIMQPPHITAAHLSGAVGTLSKKKPSPSLSKLRLEAFHEGLSVQIMHVGPYSEEGPTIERLHKFAEEKGYELRGKHHEIYMGDPRRAAPEKLKTILRHPIKQR